MFALVARVQKRGRTSDGNRGSRRAVQDRNEAIPYRRQGRTCKGRRWKIRYSVSNTGNVWNWAGACNNTNSRKPGNKKQRLQRDHPIGPHRPGYRGGWSSDL